MSAVSGTNPESLTDFGDIRWSTLELNEYAELYRDRIQPRFVGQGGEPGDRPSHQWFRDEGLRSFLAALRRYHDLSFGEFWSEVLERSDDSESGYEWYTNDPDTIEALEHFINRRRERHAGLSEASIEALRRRLNLYVRAYVEANGDDDLLMPVARDTDVPGFKATDACYAAFDYLNGEDYAATTKQRVRSAVDEWYNHLVGRRLGGMNPASGLYSEFRWDTKKNPDPPALEAEHVRQLMNAADSASDRLLVVGLAGWGLRANEVASLHVNQIVRLDDDSDVPFIYFENRKNGPGEVSILFGIGVLDEQIDAVSGDEWSGYLFPSSQSDSGHISRTTVWSRFGRLADRADLPESIEGEQPSPQLCRRFWYNAYSSVLGPVLDMVGEVAGEQGSSDPSVVVENYLKDERARRLRREFMRERLAEAFGE